jgi:hypothetical protein
LAIYDFTACSVESAATCYVAAGAAGKIVANYAALSLL